MLVSAPLSVRPAAGGARRARGPCFAASSAPDYSAPEFQLPWSPGLVGEGPWKSVEGGVTAPAGFRVAAAKAGLRRAGTRADCALVVADADAVWAGAFTLNQVAAAPVQYCRALAAAGGPARAVLVNAGQANAATGAAGDADAAASAAAVAAALGIPASSVLLESTGVIGQRIKMEAFLAAVPALAAGLSSSAAAADAAATAICTTDLVRKAAALEGEVGGRAVRVGGMCKGSGMIHPNMATMLAVLTCDAPVTSAVWRPLVARAVAASFNQITVDGDTSTNDTVIALASGAAGGPPIDRPGSPAAQQLEALVTALLVGLAKSVASDGEGATCLIEVAVSGARSLADAQRIARSVAGSDLFKAAVFGRDPNWGRIAAAAGYAGVDFDQRELAIALGPHALMERGTPLEFDAKAASGYLAEKGAAHGTVVVDVRVGSGPAAAKAWGCDLSYDYVKINADVRAGASDARACARALTPRPTVLDLKGVLESHLFERCGNTGLRESYGWRSLTTSSTSHLWQWMSGAGLSSPQGCTTRSGGLGAQPVRSPRRGSGLV